MSAKETPDDKDKDYDLLATLKKIRDEERDRYKRATSNARKIYVSVLVVIFILIFLLVLKVAPFSPQIRDEVIDSWEFVSVFCIGFLLVFYRIWSNGFVSDNVSFVGLDERNRYEGSTYSQMSADFARQIKIIKSEITSGDKAVEVPTKKISSYSFAENMRLIIESLDKQITYAEEKASTLLEVGRGFVRGGISLYIASIFIWQAYLYYINFEFKAGVIIGMASTTMIFLIMEFLGAWYLKQYRHYGDSAFSYMKVRSSYNKYMLAFCAISEYTTDDYPNAKEEMLRVLAESEKWPEIKEVNSNDFNYMLQSVESMGTVFEKLKGVFGRNSNTGAQG